MVNNEILAGEFIARLDRIERAAIAQKNVLTFDEACNYTGISKSFMYKLTSLGKIPHFKPNGKMIYFNRVEVEAWLQKNPIKTADEIQQEAANYAVLGKKGGVK